MSSNRAAYLVALGKPLEVKDAPYPTPGENEIIVHNKAVAINLIDPVYQKLGPSVFSWLKLPGVIGSDVSGEVTAVGSGVNRFKVSDRVVGHPAGAFQAYSTILDHMTSIIPNSIPYEQAAVLPLAFTTALLGLFHKSYLALDLPTDNPIPNGKALLIWGGSTSVGSNAIQLAVSAGYEVIATASPKNFDYTKEQGAARVFDYKSQDIKDELLAALKGKFCAGALAIADFATQSRNAAATTCLEVIAACEGNKFVALTMPPLPGPFPEGVSASFFNATMMRSEQALGYDVYGKYLSAAMAAGKFKPAPDAIVIGKGLQSLQNAMDQLSKGGISAKKLVVTL